MNTLSTIFGICDIIKGVEILALITLLCFYAKAIIGGFGTFFTAMREAHCEKNTDGSTGKLSHKRCGITAMILSLNYVFIFSMHTDRDIDHYVVTVIATIIILGWNLATTDQAGGLLDKLKGFMNPFSKTDDKKDA